MANTKYKIILFLIAILFFSNCDYTSKKDEILLSEAESIINVHPGDLIYFQKKKSKADKPYYEHIVQVGESMHSISQLYGVKVKNLYKMNKKDYEYVPVEGDILKLR